MKSAVENLDPTRVKLTVEVPSDELKPYIEKAYKSISANVNVPGFRRGKVPARIIDQRIGRGAVMQEAVNEAMPAFFDQAMREQEVKAIGQPEVDVTAIPVGDDDALGFTITTDVRPEITLPDFSAISVDVDTIEVKDEDVDEQLAGLRERFGTLTGVDREVRTGDFVSIDLKAVIGEQDIDAVEDISYEVGSGNMLEGMDDALVGMKEGETKEFTAPLAGGDHEGEDANVTVTVKSVKERQLPELDDEFAQLASPHDTLAALRDDVRGQVEMSKRFEQGVQARDKVLEKLLDEVEIPVPAKIVAEEVDSHFEGDHTHEGDPEEHRKEVEENVTRALKTQFLLDALVEKYEVSVEQNELVEYIVMSAQQYGMEPQQFAQLMDQNNQVPAMVAEVGRRKGLAQVLEEITIKDADGNAVDLNALNTGADAAEGHGQEDPAESQDVDTDAPAEDADAEESDPEIAEKPAKKAKKAAKADAAETEKAEKPAKKNGKKKDTETSEKE